MRAFVDQHRDVRVVASICRVLQSPSGYRRNAARRRTLALRSPRVAQRDVVAARRTRVARQSEGLGREENLAATLPRGLRGRPLHGRAADARQGHARYGRRHEGSAPAGQGQPALQGRHAEPAWGLRLPPPRPSRTGCTLPSLQTSSPGESSAGGSAARSTPASFSTPWSRRCTHANASETAGWRTTPAAAANTSRKAAASGWPRLASSPWRAHTGTATITR